KPVMYAKRLAYGLLLTACLNDVVRLFKAPPDERVSLVCEECNGVEGFAVDCFYHFKRTQANNLGQITFAAKKDFRGLQAADMMAYEGFKHVTNQAIRTASRPIRKLLGALNSTNRLAVAYASKKEIEQHARTWIGIIDAAMADAARFSSGDAS